jgi:hypothetical protein
VRVDDFYTDGGTTHYIQSKSIAVHNTEFLSGTGYLNRTAIILKTVVFPNYCVVNLIVY